MKSKGTKVVKDDMVHLHTHSDMSQLDGCGRISEYVDVAVERGNPGIAFTDHGTLRGYMAEYEACKDRGIKPIFGSEFYISPDMRRKGLTDEEKDDVTKDLPKSERKAALRKYEEHEGIRDRWHLNVWAKNDVGLKNLYRLSSASFIDGFYYKPRIDMKELQKYSEGLIVSTGCLSSPIHDANSQGKERQALDFADGLFDTFGENLRLELQPHAIRDQRVANKLTLELHDRYGGKAALLATQDAHYVHQCDSEHHEVLLCIGTGGFMNDPERFKFDGDEFHFRTRKEMYAAFRRHHEFISKGDVKRALNATIEMSEMIDAKLTIDYKAALLPEPNMPAKYGGDEFAYMRDLCLDGWRWRDVERRSREIAARRGTTQTVIYSEYAARIKHELKALVEQKFIPYFLIIRELYAYARDVNIMCGPGRGSVGGSLIAYLLGITAVDPIEHGLIFERFINPFRLDMPDIDMDFEDRRRHEIMEWLVNRFGRDKVAQIATIGRLTGKQCLRDVSRVLQVPLAEVNQVTNSIVERSSGDERASSTIADSFKEFEICRSFDQRFPQVLHHSKRLEGLAKNLGIHAAGVVTSPVPLTDLLPLEIRKHDGKDIIVTALDMYGAAAVGLVKLDVLGLRTLTVIKECLTAIEDEHGVKLDLEHESFDLNDPKALQAFTDHRYSGVFQYDTPSADKVCTGVSFDSFEDIAAMTALNRPGTSRSGLASRFVERKKNPKLVEKVDFHPMVSEITSDTLGIIVYQEHVIKIFTQCAGFAPGTADSLRKTMAKKVGDETMGKEREKFVEGCRVTSGIDAKTANKIMDAITFFGSYGFNKAHATEYGLIAYWCVAGPTRLYDFDAGEYVAISKAYKTGVGRIACYDEKTGKTIPGVVKKIIKTGPKNSVKVRTTSGRSVVCSEKHLILTPDGYVEAGLLRPGSKIAAERRVSPASSPDVAKKIGEGAKRAAASKTPEQRRHQAAAAKASLTLADRARYAKESWAKASPEERLARTDNWVAAGGFKCVKRGPGACGQMAFSLGEMAVCKWLHGNGLEHEHQPAVGNGRRADFSCKGVFIEYDGMSRTDEYFDTKFGDDESYEVLKSHAEIADKLGFLLEAGEIAAGREITFQEVESVTQGVGHVVMYDVVMEEEPHNFLANNIVVHNCMWLKVYYPIEFYWALLKCQPDRIRIAQLAKGAKKEGIELLPPHVNVSNAAFAIDRKANAIRGSLVDIKGVGPAAAKSIQEHQPFTDFWDFMERVDRRAVHSGVCSALAKASAFDGMLPSTKWFVENIKEVWKQMGRKKGDPQQMFKDAEGADDYDEEDMSLVSSSVNPLAFGKHPIDAYGDFIGRAIKVPLTQMGDGDGNGANFFKDNDNKGTIIAGVIVEVKFNQIGDFHTGAMPSESERKEMFWGARYANVNIEDSSGKQNRCKFDFDIFPRFRPLIDAGVGTPVLAHVLPNAKFENLRAQFAVDLSVLRKKIGEGAPLSVWESIMTGKHPALVYDMWKNDAVAAKRVTNGPFFGSPNGGIFTGVVTHVRLKYDKKGNLMAFFGLVGGDGRYIDAIAFASVWQYVRKAIKPGSLVRVAIEKKADRSRGWSHFCGQQVKVLRRDKTESAV